MPKFADPHDGDLFDQPRVTEVGDYIFRICFIDPFRAPSSPNSRTLPSKPNASPSSPPSTPPTASASPPFSARTSRPAAADHRRAKIQRRRKRFPRPTHCAPPPQTRRHRHHRVLRRSRPHLPQARALGIDVPFIGGDGWEAPNSSSSAAKPSKAPTTPLTFPPKTMLPKSAPS